MTKFTRFNSGGGGNSSSETTLIGGINATISGRAAQDFRTVAGIRFNVVPYVIIKKSRITEVVVSSANTNDYQIGIIVNNVTTTLIKDNGQRFQALKTNIEVPENSQIRIRFLTSNTDISQPIVQLKYR